VVVVAFEHPPDVDRNAAEKKKNTIVGLRKNTNVASY
jgi:hypothetical protein